MRSFYHIINDDYNFKDWLDNGQNDDNLFVFAIKCL